MIKTALHTRVTPVESTQRGTIFLKAFLFVCLTLDAQALGKKNVVKTDAGGKIITSSTSCAPAKWKGDAKSSCSCCIVKHVTKMGLHKEFDESKIPCSKYCTVPVLRDIRHELKLGDADIKSTYQAIYNNFGGLQFIQITHNNLEPNGNLNVAGVEELIFKIKNPNNTQTPANVKSTMQGNSYKAKALGGGGAQTLQLFLITNPQNKGEAYILKGLKKASEEIANIDTIRKSDLGKLYTYDPKKPPASGVPSLALDVHNFKYRDTKNKDHDVALITAAPGSGYNDFIMKWSKGEGGTVEGVKKALEAIGDGLATIHQKFNKEKGKVMGKTYAHGDLHPHNVFYDQSGNRPVFIDTESFALSIKNPRDPSVDIMKFWGRLVATQKDPKHNYQQNKSDDEFRKVVIEPFIKGYVVGYAKVFKNAAPSKDLKVIQQEVLNRLYDIMIKQGAIRTFVDNNKTILSSSQLAEKQKTIGIPAFQEVAKQLKLMAPGGNPPATPNKGGKGIGKMIRR